MLRRLDGLKRAPAVVGWVRVAPAKATVLVDEVGAWRLRDGANRLPPVQSVPAPPDSSTPRRQNRIPSRKVLTYGKLRRRVDAAVVVFRGWAPFAGEAPGGAQAP